MYTLCWWKLESVKMQGIHLTVIILYFLNIKILRTKLMWEEASLATKPQFYLQ